MMTVKVYLVSCSSMARSTVVVRSIYYRVVTIYNYTPSDLLSELQWSGGKKETSVEKWMNIYIFVILRFSEFKFFAGV